MISNINLGRFYFVVPNKIEIIIYYLFIFYIFDKNHYKFIRKTIKKIITLLLIIIISISLFNKLDKKLEIHFIDVGQGDSSLIITPKGKKILIDGGGDENYNIGNNVLIPYLLSKKINTIDYIIVSHFDTDHVGGLISVAEHLKTKNIIISKQINNSKNLYNLVKIANSKNINIIQIRENEIIDIEKDIKLLFLWPRSNEMVLENSLNNNSIVCKLYYNDFSILFTGDIEKESEKRIIKEYDKKILKSNVIKIAHHGSKTSTTSNFIDTVSPSIALIGVGENNNFDHPNIEIINRLKENNIDIYRTDLDGEITLTINKKGRIKTDRYCDDYI